MTWDTFQERANYLRFSPELIRDLKRFNLVTRLNQDFTLQDCQALVHVAKQGLLHTQSPPQQQVAGTPIVLDLSVLAPHFAGQGYIPQETEPEEETNDGAPDWIIVLSIIMVIAALIAVILFRVPGAQETVISAISQLISFANGILPGG